MLNAFSKIPVKSQKSIATGLLWTAAFAFMFGLLMLMSSSGSPAKTKTECNGQLWWEKCVEQEIPKVEPRSSDLIVGIVLFTIALVCVVSAFKLTTIQGRLKKYVAILTGVEYMGIQQIAIITNSSPYRVRSDIQGMIDSGMISDFHINYQTDQVVSKKYIPKTSYKTVQMCSRCGANNELIVGITRPCAFCGRPLARR